MLGQANELDDLTVGEAMHPGVLTCPPETSLRDVAVMMSRYRVHAVVVYSDVDESEAPPFMWGVVSDADLVAAAVADDLRLRTAGGSASSPVVTISQDETLRYAAQLMTENHTAHLVVVSPGRERPLGVVSTLDVAREVARLARDG